MAVNRSNDYPPAPRTFGEIFRSALARRSRSRTVSFALLGGMLLVILLGVQMVYLFDDPRRLALFLALNFTFFLFVIFRATLECFDILREHIRDREHLFQSVFCEDDFVEQLGQRVRKRS